MTYDEYFMNFLGIRYSHSGRNNDVDPSSHMLTIATRDLFNELDKSVKPVAPMQFWMVHYIYSVHYITNCSSLKNYLSL